MILKQTKDRLLIYNYQQLAVIIKIKNNILNKLIQEIKRDKII